MEGTSQRVVEIPVDVWLHILSFLEFRDLCHLSQLNNFFHDLCQDESTWRRLVLRNGWKRDPHTSSWKECFKYFWQPRRCVRCNELYRECSNGWQACVHHPGERALWEDYNSGPSGVYWTCCEKRAKDAPGCKPIGRHCNRAPESSHIERESPSTAPKQ